ncbi:SDR family NAD(P)-dependent oxidoreductase [Mycobacterium sp. pW049]|uniref:SDR family NAD(P)-dependent oxidoreductase n=1 Tax=[Mycobacterium] bulgaricum TaxID=3238985 RepID=UPI00351AEFEF
MAIAGKVAIITGATSGVGRGVAVEFARRGAKVIATGRRRSEGDELEKSARADGHDLTFVGADVTSEADCDRVAEAAVAAHGRIDVLVCNAGIVNDPAVVDTHTASLEWWNQIVTTNLTGTFLSCRAVLPQMMSQYSGVILAISSINAEVPVSRMAAYNCSKAAITQFTRTLAIEYLMYGIRANTVILGATHGSTNDAVNQSVMAHAEGGPLTIEELENNRQINEALGEKPENVGAALALLASDELAGMTATNVHLDRGLAAGFLTDMAIYKTVSDQWSFAT